MKKRNTSLIMMAGLIAAATLFSSNQIGVSGKSVVGCGGGGCHTYSINTTMSMLGVPAAGYQNGQTYTLYLTVSNAAKVKAGFNLTVNAGSLSAGSGMSLVSATELKHNAPLLMNSGNATWSFSWTAPATGTSPVSFYVAGNATDSSGTAQGDAFNTTVFTYNAEQLSMVPQIANVITTAFNDTSFTASADVNPGNATTAPYIEYGPTTTYGNSVVMSPAILNGSNALPVNITINGLTPGGTYHYRIKASNANGTVYSQDKLVVLTNTPNAVSNVKINTISVYPNPANDVLHVVGLPNEPIRSVCVFNAMGQLMPSPNLDVKQLTCFVNGLAPGRYVLELQCGKQMYRTSFFKR
ncbi:MAG: T9SS type A sorting domain-containing protein [Chitinophagaceae bacterium]|nr:T9SS type A sorting domain-containing protein [Chitinophagaceae bacterium]